MNKMLMFRCDKMEPNKQYGHHRSYLFPLGRNVKTNILL